MNNDKRHLQLRLDPDTRAELEELATKFEISVSDVIRGILFFGIPVFETFTDLSREMIRRLVDNLKRDSRKKA